MLVRCVCGREFSLADRHAGQEVRCSCGNRLRVPPAAAPTPSAPAAGSPVPWRLGWAALLLVAVAGGGLLLLTGGAAVAYLAVARPAAVGLEDPRIETARERLRDKMGDPEFLDAAIDGDVVYLKLRWTFLGTPAVDVFEFHFTDDRLERYHVLMGWPDEGPDPFGDR